MDVVKNNVMHLDTPDTLCSLLRLLWSHFQECLCRSPSSQAVFMNKWTALLGLVCAVNLSES